MKSEHFINKREIFSTFEDFIYGNHNKILITSLEDIIETKAASNNLEINFIFLKGSSISGKSHLLEACALKMKELDESAKVLIAKAKELVVFFTEQKKYSKKIQELENLDLLLIDDVHLLSAHKECQEELCQLLDILQKKNTLIISTYCSSHDMQNQASVTKAMYLEQNFYSLLTSGLNFNIYPPNIDIMMRYTQKEAERRELAFSHAMCLSLARFCYDIRQLQGLLKTIEVYSKAHTEAFTETSLLAFLENYEGKKEVSPELILDFVAQYYSLQVKDLKGKSRFAHVVMARQMSMFLCRRLLAYSYPRIAQLYGGKDHTTIIYACEKIEKDSNSLKLAQKLMQKIIQESSL